MLVAGSYVLREATNADCGQIWLLISGVLSEFAIAADLATTDIDLGDIEGNYANLGGAFFVLVDGDDIIGTVALGRDSDLTCELCRMYLATRYRRRGLGRVLLDSALKEASRRGFGEVRLETARVLVQAIALYQSVGFAIIDASPVGKNCNVVMRKSLE
jgi:putative acetyltransferase